ncbi:P-loop containing nucleoside triphosphate hydrolase protein [Parachaetomium inaequale]|uniref:P-loop containing nucleoside triphosphate hydrolase protein n=1 Tax=Parachaetomium inaequale TaxID=2588326 RepID=A0AAN6P556_9PEZI|nr:P-loop containing nucleoside triphosphate hydrolase protein [Parachaetomium inaequale]
MSVRVVARIRPLLEKELDKDVIVHADRVDDGKPLTLVKIPSPKNGAEEFSFAFNSVYEQATSQEALFTAEVAPHMKALFQGLDVTIFAYGVTGTGKTHTMRGGLRLAERGVIPRLLSNVFRRGKKMMKDTDGATTVAVALSYYEIYNDKVYDLLEPPEKRTPAGLPLREKDGKTMVVGLSERCCEDLKDFEKLYIEANNNRVTASTKLNAHSSRSHAILRVKVTQTTGDMVKESTASAIDLAGSEDNRRTDNGKERLVESAAINKSLFVLSQCIDAISRGDKRIPYRESKMTRILSLGQNNGITIMILNLAPIRSYHLDTLSSLNVSSRAKRIEVREIENEIVYKQAPRTNSGLGGAHMQRQPLRPLNNAHNVHTGALAAKAADKAEKAEKPDKPVKLFAVYTDKKPAAVVAARTIPAPAAANTSLPRQPLQSKSPSETSDTLPRPSKLARPTAQSLLRPPQPITTTQISITPSQIEAMVEKKVAEILASRAAAEAEAAAAAAPQPTTTTTITEPTPTATTTTAGTTTQPEISDEVQRRLEALERRIDSESRSDDSRSEGLRFLLQARQAKERGDEEGALRFYERALPFFPGQAKLLGKIERLRVKLGIQRKAERKGRGKKNRATSGDEEYQEGTEADIDEDEREDDHVVAGRSPARGKGASKKRAPKGGKVFEEEEFDGPASPRARQLLEIVNSRDLVLIKGLHGFGAKKAQDLVDCLTLRGDGASWRVESLAQLRMLPGMGGRTVERACEGLVVAPV